jgi:SAM-dependent methyltransferase
MKKYNSWGYEQQDEYEEQLRTIYATDWREGLEHAGVSKEFGIYGEVTHRGVENILSTCKSYFDDPSGVFYDLGCGTGKLISHVALGSKLSKVCGIEYDPLRYSKAKKLIDNVTFPYCTPSVLNEDMFESDYSDATIIFFENTMWSAICSKEPAILERLLSTVRKGTLIILKETAPIWGDTWPVKIETTYGVTSGYCVVYSALALDK